MNYHISKSQLANPIIKDIIRELNHHFNPKGISFFVIGAMARDINMQIHNEQSGRLTEDLDIALTVDNWEQWEKLKEDITTLENFTKDKQQPQRFLYRQSYQLDIVPYGAIRREDNKIYWPPDERFAMSVLGYDPADQSLTEVLIDGEVKFKVAALDAICMLKLIAWQDRHHKTNKDAEDIGFILMNYLQLHEERAVNYYDTVYRDENDTIPKRSASLLGIDLSHLLSAHQTEKLTLLAVLDTAIEDPENSRLIDQLLLTTRTITFDEALACMENIRQGLME
jgi:predicted nucleotidyltransferase